MVFGYLNRRHLMVHNAFPNIATPLMGYWLERILRNLENHNIASSILNFLCIYNDLGL